jgi:hypothetical protein
MGAPFFTGWTFGVDETSDGKSESVCYTCSHAIVISERPRTKILEFFGLEELLTGGESITVLS